MYKSKKPLRGRQDNTTGNSFTKFSERHPKVSIFSGKYHPGGVK